MSMLAERKRKQKWSLNPRGKDWAEDSNKFGQKMLEKMGWQHGKGLGAKEDGIVEHIKISYKNDSKGMGYKESSDQWTEHESNFSALLESLSGEKTVEVKLNSLEKKSQNSKARVHYHKFTRGKDLSRYSEKDLANIFGKKSLKDSSEKEVTTQNSDSLENNKESESKFIFNGGSMRDYFKKKLPSFGKSNGYVVGHNGVLKTEKSDAEDGFRPSFSFNSVEKDDEAVSYVGFGFKNETTSDNVPKISNGAATFVSYVNGSSNEEPIEKKSKKKRRVEEIGIDNIFSPRKKSRKSKEDVSKKYVSELDSERGLLNPAFNPLRTPIKVQKHILGTIEESVSEDMSDVEDNSVRCIDTTVEVHEAPPITKMHLLESSCGNVVKEQCSGLTLSKKKSKKLKALENGLINSVFMSNDVVDLTLKGGKENEVEISPYEVKRKGSKKKNDERNGIYENPNFNENAEENSQTEENPYEVKVKKLKKKKEKNELVQCASVDLTTDNSAVSSTLEETPSKVKDKKKKKSRAFALENPSFDDVEENAIDLTQIEENPYEVKIKRKNKKSKESFDNLNFNQSVEDDTRLSQNEENPYEVKITQKKKKNKKEAHYAIENPNFNESLENSTCNEVEENPYEVKPKKKKKKKAEKAAAIDNPNFDLNNITDTNNDNNVFEVERKKKKIQENNEGTSHTPENISINIEDSDLMLNVVTTPIIKKTEQVNGENAYSITRINSAKRRKSVRFSDVTQERIIPNNDDLRNLSDIENRNELFEINTLVINQGLEQQNISFDMSSLDKISYDDNGSAKLGKNKILGLDNAAFDKHKTNLEENLDSITKTLDRYEAEIENDINEKKLETLIVEDIMLGEVGNPHGEHEKLPEGTKLKFRYANFESKVPFYHLDKTGAKKSYKHLIKGDIVLHFKNTNLHEIQGYAIKSSK